MSRDEDILGPMKGNKNGRPPSRWRQSLMAQPSPPKQDEPTPMVIDSKAPKIQAKGSRMSLFNLFSKPNVQRARGHHEVGLQLPERPKTPPTPAVAAPPIPPKSALRPAASPGSTAPNVLLARQPGEDVTKLKSSKSASSVPRRSRHNAHWTPPPLFQAYPQAIKYATLTSSTSSAESMLRSQQEHRRQQSILKENIAKGRQDLSQQEDGKPERSKLTSKRLSAAVPFYVSDFTTKIYILVTSGYVLQYAGSGAFDRLPEKVLQLGPDSAAFASDIISGKHWVLQISQTAQEDGTVASNQRGLMARLRLQNANTRRQASNFLLVLESAEDMDSWLNAVRKEIDVLGGKEHRTEAPSPNDDFSAHHLERNPSHRYSVQRDPHQYNINGSPVQPSNASTTTSGSPTIVASEWDDVNRRLSLNGSESGSVKSSKPSSARHSSETMTTISPGSVQLNQLREGSRLSIMSVATSVSDTLTEATSGISTPEASPMAETFFRSELVEPSRDPTSLKSFAMNPTLGSNRRRSVQTFKLPTTDEDTTDSSEHTRSQDSISAGFNRPPRYRPGIPIEKKQPPAFRRSTSAPAPRIPLPPLPLSESLPPRSISPPPLSPPPRGKSFSPISSYTLSEGKAAPSASEDFPVSKTVNFSRRRSAMPDMSCVTRHTESLGRRGSGQSSASSLPSPQDESFSRQQSAPHLRERTTPSPSFNFSLPTHQSISRSPPSQAQSSQPTMNQTTCVTTLELVQPLPFRQSTVSNVPPAQRESKDLQAIIIPRRRQTAGRPLPFPIKPNRPMSVQQPPPQTPSYHQLRRPNSMQINTNHAPFASNLRSVHRSTSASSVAGPPPTTNISNLLSGPITKSKSGYFRDNVLTEPLRQHSAPQLMTRSMARLPPRAQPPNMPLPPRPPPNMPLPQPPSTMPLPLPPPTMPLPPPPPQMAV
ncbi:hypothetical protein EJ05DRAFT_497006 [Pseudovirgaria hyperparasitica]|uniref:PH domain-containing protein n=1 Tax=Pseudovirgaria hyperparasitica TaxID=470096 RepID=A0A6A6WIM3_9PEZI|nr:uncharacterized protein EJ05DRAFT_497006 [Pseudovirgaria hyperparasitica]KAF2762139.1 hypothetical protein EJ05DRAFT_497006 [Pseudovirgaria hyperparasitica]